MVEVGTFIKRLFTKVLIAPGFLAVSGLPQNQNNQVICTSCTLTNFAL
jgi:hypothetical protein